MNGLKWQTAGMGIAALIHSFIIALLGLDPSQTWILMFTVGTVALAYTLYSREYLIWGFAMHSFIAGILGVTNSVDITWLQQLNASIIFAGTTVILFLLEGVQYAYKTQQMQSIAPEQDLVEKIPQEETYQELSYEDVVAELKEKEKSPD